MKFRTPEVVASALVAGLALAMTAKGTGAGDAPEGPWRQYADLDAAGWSGAKLIKARELAESVGSASVFAVHNGVVVAAWGEVTRAFPLFSMRKGMYNALYGTAVAAGEIDLGATLADLGVDDLGGLTDMERTATIEHLLTSRSGIYHVSAFEPASMKRSRPPRGAHRPGEHWFYNNWGFNAAAGILERAAGASIAELFHDRIAGPLGLEDFSTDDVFSFYEPSRSRFAAPIFRMTARDLARVGLLYLREGDWNGQWVMTPEWIRASFTPASIFASGSRYGAGNGFGYLWWILPGDQEAERVAARHDGFITRGSGGQVLAVVPSMKLVVVHLTDTENDRGLGFGEAVRVFGAIMAARMTDGRIAADVPTIPVIVQPLAGAEPAPPTRRAIAWTPSMIESVIGEYRLNPKISFVLHEVNGRVFALPTGAPLAEVEVFAETPDRLFSPAVELLLDVHRGNDGRANSLSGRLDGNDVLAQRVEE